jgi:hypothetical protein
MLTKTKKSGELIEPLKPIVYYIDPATPEKWKNIIKQVLMIGKSLLKSGLEKCLWRVLARK